MKAMPSLRCGLGVVAMLVAVGAAQAQTAAPSLMTAHLAQPAAAPLQSKLGSGQIDLTRQRTLFDVAYDRAGPARIPGIAKTSVDGRLASDDLTGHLGFLCGLEPGAEKKGAAAARGYDPTGRFVGAKLSLAFR